MDNNISNLSIDDLLSKRSESLEKTLESFDKANNSTSISDKPIESNSVCEQETPDIELAELNYITNYLKNHAANSLSEKLNRLYELQHSRNFTTEKAIASIKTEEESVFWHYSRLLDLSKESKGKLKGKRLLFLLIAIVLLFGAAILSLGGLIIIGIALLVAALVFFVKRKDLKDDLKDIKDAKIEIEQCKNIASLGEGKTIIYH